MVGPNTWRKRAGLRDLCGDLLDLLERYDLVDWFGLVERLVSLVLLDLDLRELRDLRGL